MSKREREGMVKKAGSNKNFHIYWYSSLYSHIWRDPECQLKCSTLNDDTGCRNLHLIIESLNAGSRHSRQMHIDDRHFPFCASWRIDFCK